MKKISDGQKRFIICAIGIGIFAISYVYLYMRFQELTSVVNSDTNILKQQISERQDQIEKKDKTEQEIIELKQQKADLINQYPVYLAKEDNFMFVEKLQDNLKVKITSISPSDSTVFYETQIPVVQTEGQAETEYDPSLAISSEYMTGLQSTISLSFQTTYGGLKKLVNYMNTYPEKTVINDISVSYDNTTGNLSGSLNISRYSLTGTGKIYEPPYISDISIGTDNIFGTIDLLPKNKSKNQ